MAASLALELEGCAGSSRRRRRRPCFYRQGGTAVRVQRAGRQKVR